MAIRLLPELEAVPARELEFLGRYGRAAPWTQWKAQASDPRPKLVEDAVRLLETILAGAGVVEAASILGARTIADAEALSERIRSLAKSLTGLDPVATVEEHRAALRVQPAQPPSPDLDLGVVLQKVIWTARLLISMEVRHVEEWAEQLEMEAWGHRCRRAHDALRAFLRRTASRPDALATAVGRLYAQGRIGIDEAAGLLHMQVPDTLMLFEQAHFCRTPETIRLDDAERQGILERIREDRRRRSGRPDPSRDQLDRDVLANQRIEQVDARRWLHDDDA